MMEPKDPRYNSRIDRAVETSRPPSSVSTNIDCKEGQQIIIQSGNYNVTVIPMGVEYPRNRIYGAQNMDHFVGHHQLSHQYGHGAEYIHREPTSRSTHFNSSTLCAITQRIPVLNNYCHDPIKNYSGLQQQNQVKHYLEVSKILNNYCHHPIKNYSGLQQQNQVKHYLNVQQPNQVRNYSEFHSHQVKNFSELQKRNNDRVVRHAVDVKKQSLNVEQHGFEHFAQPVNTTMPSSSRVHRAAQTTKAVTNSKDVIPMSVFLHNRTCFILEIEETSSATCEMICQAIINCDELGLNKNVAAQVFTLWMVSPLLELQLKPGYKPFEIKLNWKNLVNKYSPSTLFNKENDEPKLMFQRNVFFPKNLEEKIKDQKIIELLYEESKYNILSGRYLCEIPHYIMLGGIQAREELGPYNPQIHSTHYFREEQSNFLPYRIRKSSTWTWFPVSSKTSAEVRLLEQFKRIPASATNRKLMKKYVEFCWSLPMYGSAFFDGQIEEPTKGLWSYITKEDIPVLIAINYRGICIMDDLEAQVLLGLKYEEFSWEFAKPSREGNPDCLPCLFIQFLVYENGARVSKILQVFSKQAFLMDTLINSFVTQTSPRNGETDNKFDGQGNSENDAHGAGSSGNSNPYIEYSVLSNKLSKLALATFDEDGHCVGHMGSWSFS